MAAHAGDDVPKDLGVASTSLPLTLAPKIAASRDEEKEDNHGQDGRESS